MRKFVCKFSVRRRATHQTFGRRRFENFLTSQKCCIESMGRALPKTRASGAEFAQKFASTTLEFAANFPRIRRVAHKFFFRSLKILFCKSKRPRRSCNAIRKCVERRKKLAFGAEIAEFFGIFFRQKMRKLVVKFLLFDAQRTNTSAGVASKIFYRCKHVASSR